MTTLNTLTLTDANSVVFVFNDSFELDEHSFKASAKPTHRAFGHGGRDHGDGKFEHRTLRVKGHVYGETQAEFNTNYDSLLAAVVKENQTLRWGSLGRYLPVRRCLAIKEELVSNVEKVAKVELDFLLEDPFWQYEVPRSVATDLTSPVTTFTLVNTAPVEVHPVLTLVSSEANTRFQFTNTADNSLTFVYEDTNLTQGSTLTVNGVLGTVERGTLNTIRNFTGSFLRLRPGVNTIVYSGSKGKLTSVYRERTF